MTITDLSLGESGAKDLSNRIKDLITEAKGKVLDSSDWGKRKFAYEIEHKTEGFYEVILFELPQKNMTEFKKKLTFIDGLVRYLVVGKEE